MPDSPLAYTNLDWFPVVLAVLHDGYSLVDLEYALEPHEAALQRGQPFVTVRDVRGAGKPPTPLQRARFASWQQDWADLAERNCLGVATLTDSLMMRGALQAYLWMVPPLMPEKSFSTAKEAAPWLAERLASADVPEPPILKRWRDQGQPFPVTQPPKTHGVLASRTRGWSEPPPPRGDG